ncbi:hypothetical protein [Ferrimicrobium acidiphilum]|uniref:hypothetical protein n=1 Tax=Ferrimicrobium acidiphilum TaxID=121039 RepID=UPI000555906F|nr:hypothetical protein [Ferrimicrobium acidiphilum]
MGTACSVDELFFKDIQDTSIAALPDGTRQPFQSNAAESHQRFTKTILRREQLSLAVTREAIWT